MRAWFELFHHALRVLAPLVTLAPLSAGANGLNEDPLSKAVPPAYTAAALRHAVPPVVLYALAHTESGTALKVGKRPWPWTLNISGRGYRYPNRTQACQALNQALKTTRVIDVGLGQLNIRWNPALFGSEGRFSDPCDALDPYDNLDATAALLRQRFDQDDHGNNGDWGRAAGRYHRPAGGAPAQRYRRAFLAEMKALNSATVFLVHQGGQGDTTAERAAPPGHPTYTNEFSF
ncbi:transglycosylase SLT domain-containing protein [Alloalcanivorax xenomutans]|uniref:Transglycosylase SLT domain-containing protein n=1 Tax=Alloalcanivorax xenomutans TaxID=1094342 RepID=A0A9Q3W6F7_9GAMM|nr:transglycosylase SLT domain-containing protein [Alloalcanivorax xenomutans]MCE7509167.1 transglycosylase SLT domain-containing protein [Alloalcanivorax xenomutans]WOA33471.1 transglycosylase SLT domain-containing protein [Alloalcanivorax xenomutans]